MIAVIFSVSHSSGGKTSRIDNFQKATDPSVHFGNLVQIAQACFEEQRPCAEAYAREALGYITTNVEAGRANAGEVEAFHDSHVVLGELALAKGDVAQAKEHLRLATAFLKDGVGNSKMRSARILNMSLAGALIRKGEVGAVLRYLELLDQKWDRPEIGTWKEDVAHGTVPDFGKYVE